MLTILITIIAIIGWIGCVYYKGKAKEFESLFELSKKYEPVVVAQAKYIKATNSLHPTNLDPTIHPAGLRVGINKDGKPKGLTGSIYGINIPKDRNFNVPTNHTPKTRYNKDGSIAKKRGPKPKVQK